MEKLKQYFSKNKKSAAVAFLAGLLCGVIGAVAYYISN
jgi:hypothetical protein